MKRSIHLIFALWVLGMVFSVSSKAQIISIPFGTAPLIDGVVQPNEWTDANAISIPIHSTDSSKVLFKHDSTHLYFAFKGGLQSSGNYFPELVIDAEWDRASSFQQNDWWFHVSATDCEYNGQYGNYTNCQIVRPGWEALPNYSSTRSVDSVEIKISLNMLGVQIGDSVGIAFLLNNFMTIKQYPVSANHLVPSTWKPFVLAQPMITNLKENVLHNTLSLWPNPAEDYVTVQFNLQTSNSAWFTILNNRGQVIDQGVWDKVQLSQGKRINLSNYDKGLYVLQLITDRGLVRERFIKN